ncbi:MAG: response regulator [Parvularcula sp.]
MSKRTSPSHIHIVEDDLAVRDAISTVLSIDGFKVSVWGNGLSFLKEAQLRPYDVVILDIKMPGLTGTAVAEELHQRAPGVRVIVVSGLTVSEFDRAIGIIRPFAAFRKPLNALDLIASVRAATSPEFGTAS